MQSGKYIIFEGTTGFDGFIFPKWIEHADFARKFQGWTPISAGFIEITPGYKSVIKCFGESHSLKLSAQPGDEAAFKWLIQ